jgi:phage terminase large subunit GpA-like protein
VQKSAQVGLTELAVNRALHAADTALGGRGNVFYVMPTKEQVEDFAQARFDAAIQDSAYLRSRLQPEPPRRKGADSTRQKQLGNGRIFMRGAESSRQVASIDADLVILMNLMTCAMARLIDSAYFEQRSLSSSQHLFG